jgi:hypothetical protein
MPRDMNLGGCGPVQPPNSPVQSIRAWLSEIVGVPEQGIKGLGPEDYRGVVVPMYVTLDSATSVGLSGTEKHKVPSTHFFAVTGIQGFVAMPSWQNDDTHAGNTNPNTDAVEGMMWAKGMTTMITLTNTDIQQPIIEGRRQLNLSTIMNLRGGKAVDWLERPHIVPAGQQLELVVTWNDSTVAGAGSEGGTLVQQYGVNLHGYYIRSARS